MCPVERLDAQAIASEHRGTRLLVPDTGGELPAELNGVVLSKTLVEVRKDLRVTPAGVSMAGSELPPQFEMVVELAVLNRVDSRSLVLSRLVAFGDVHDRQSPH